jgi:hypothetical protein
VDDAPPADDEAVVLEGVEAPGALPLAEAPPVVLPLLLPPLSVFEVESFLVDP